MVRLRVDWIELISDNWEEMWPGSRQYILKQVSDHCALVVKDKIIDWGPKPFGSFNAWEKLDDYMEVVRQA